MEWIVSLTVLLLGSLLIFILQVLTEEPLLAIIARRLSIFVPRRSRSLQGIWMCSYCYCSHDKILTERQVVVLRQIGSYVWGMTQDADNHCQKLTGWFRDSRHFTGTWENLKREHSWHGAFQFELHYDGNSMKGRWVGFENSSGANADHGSIQTGPWTWTLLNPDIREFDPDDPFKGFEQAKFPVSVDDDLVRDLIERYKTAWIERDDSQLDTIFTKDAKYMENALKPPYEGLEAIRNYWREKIIDNQRNITFDLKAVEIYDSIVKVLWDAEFDDIEDQERKFIKELALLKIRKGKIASIEEYWITQTGPMFDT